MDCRADALLQLPSDLRAVLTELVSGAQAALGDEFVGTYLVGSFALGAGDAHSDVDFLVVTRDAVDEATLDALQALHARLFALPSPWAQHLEGAYMPLEGLQVADPTALAIPYLDNGAQTLVYSTHCSSLVDRWLFRERGIALAGPPPATLAAPVPREALKAEIRTVIRDWGHELLTRPDTLASRWAWPFAVLSFCRMLQSLQTGTIESKPEGVRWALATLPAKWHPLIQRAWIERDDPWTKVHLPASAQDIAHTKQFVAWAMTATAL